MQYLLALIVILVLLFILIKFRVFFFLAGIFGLAIAASIKYFKTLRTASPEDAAIQKDNLLELLLCLFFGWAGGHKFYRKHKKLGILYLLTLGLFCIGWWGDLISLGSAYFRKKELDSTNNMRTIKPYLAAFLCVLVLGSCNSPRNSEDTQDKSVSERESSSETEQSTEKSSNQQNTDPSNPNKATTPTEDTPEPTETTAPTVNNTEPAETTAPTEAETEPTEEDRVEMTYILNTNTKKFHYEWCSSAKQTKESNKRSFTGTRDEVVDQGYKPCGRCNP